jgi:hypothetical protein
LVNIYFDFWVCIFLNHEFSIIKFCNSDHLIWAQNNW